jgi:predicted RNA-binding Zn-ribbon protein involved in translation (DUF1610 family)
MSSMQGQFRLRSCAKCEFDLAELPQSARYCPHCGFDLIEQAAQPRPVLPLVGSRYTRSPLVRAFAGAIYRLGARYEANLGVRANRHEAIRCYQKAAKLGNELAADRLTAQDPSTPSGAK